MPKKEKNLINRSGVWYWAQVIRGKRYCESLQTGDLKVARLRMAIKQKAAEAEDYGALYGTRSKAAFPTLGKIFELYLAEVESSGKLDMKTAGRNCSTLRKIMDTAGIEEPDAASLSELTEDLLKKFSARMLAVNDTPSARRTIQSMIRQARSLFSRKMDYHHEITMPKGLARFLTATPVQAPKVNNALPDPEVITELVKAGRKLRDGENKAIYLAFLLCYDLGLRNGEARDCRKSWFYRNPDGIWLLDLIDRPDENYFPKTPRKVGIPVPASIMQDIQKFGGEDYVLPLGKTDRENLMKYDLSNFVRQFIPDGTKSVYVLRRLRGSFWSKYYSTDRTFFWMGHTSMQTTLNHYAIIPKIDEPFRVDQDLEPLRHFNK